MSVGWKYMHRYRSAAKTFLIRGKLRGCRRCPKSIDKVYMSDYIHIGYISAFPPEYDLFWNMK